MGKHCPSPVITADILCHSLIKAAGDDDITRGWGSSYYLLMSRHLITMIIKLLEHSVTRFIHLCNKLAKAFLINLLSPTQEKCLHI